MAQYQLLMPKLGESVTDATVLRWCKNVGERVEIDETVLEIATDKVDSVVPSEVSGVIVQLLHPENTVVEVGAPLAIIETEATATVTTATAATVSVVTNTTPSVTQTTTETTTTQTTKSSDNGRFYSPLVRTIAEKEQISAAELDQIEGTGQGGRVTKSDVLTYIEMRKNGDALTNRFASPSIAEIPYTSVAPTPSVPPLSTMPKAANNANIEIIEMDRMRQLIAKHMIDSLQTSPHVTSFVEADVTNLVNWRNRIKGEFKKKYGENLTFTPIFVEAVCRALREFPLVNSSVEGTKILVKKDLNIGMAAALPSGNLIVPVIKNADTLNLIGLSKQVNDLAQRARAGALKADEIQGGTFTITNVGTFGNLMGTPIINQPQVAILATGAIVKKPAVLETEYGDVIAIRHKMYLSMSYDHRIVDGALGGKCLRRIADFLEQFDPNRAIF